MWLNNMRVILAVAISALGLRHLPHVCRGGTI